MISNLSLSRKSLQFLDVEAIGYGAKDTGEMGGGAAAAVLQAAGPSVLATLEEELIGKSPSVGDVFVTPGFKMEEGGVRWILHIISIIQGAPTGAHCPQPEKLVDGVAQALFAAASRGVRTVGLSALATGEGRVSPERAASLMLRGVREFQREQPDSRLRVTFSLPTYDDYRAFLKVLSHL